MFDRNYMLALPKNRVLAAYQICNDLFEEVRRATFFKKQVPRVALLSDDEVRDAQLILQELLEGEFADIRETPRSNNFLVAAFQGGRDFRIAWIQKIHRQLKARLLVLHVDEDSY